MQLRGKSCQKVSKQAYQPQMTPLVFFKEASEAPKVNASIFWSKSPLFPKKVQKLLYFGSLQQADHTSSTNQHLHICLYTSQVSKNNTTSTNQDFFFELHPVLLASFLRLVVALNETI